jgi:hypothetical protein
MLVPLRLPYSESLPCSAERTADPGAVMFGFISTAAGGAPSTVGPRLLNDEIVSVVHVVEPTVNASG